MHHRAKPSSEQVVRHACDDAAVGLCYFDTELRYEYINGWLARLNGLPVEKHLGRKVSEVVPEVASGIEAQLRQVIETKQPIIEGTVEAETPAQPGVRRTFLHNYLPVTAGDGEVVGVTCFVQDITARRKAEVGLEQRTVELEQSNRELQQALDNIKTLSGLVPICAHCKSIRDDEGFWQQLEVYVSQHSDAQFSHGICPACLKMHYPDVAGDPG
ncbi:MAG: PAS domain-containing protein [Gammaproteobacteria bacterium]|nr:PAS domain-containing protein [Gammaproteobacteria bacterium]